MRFGPYLAWAVLVLGCFGARADDFGVGGSGGGVSGSGVLTVSTTPGSNGGDLIEGITGTPGVTGLIGVNGFNGNDNLLFPGQTVSLDGTGFAFTDVIGDTGFDVDLFYSSGLQGYEATLLDSDGFGETIPVDFALGSTAPPLPLAADRRLLALPADGTMEVPFTFSEAAAVTPEPASFMLLGTGFLGLAAAVRRRRSVAGKP